MKHTMFLIQSLIRSKASVSKLSQRSIIPNLHSISRPPFTPPPPTSLGDRAHQPGTYAPFFSRAGDKDPVSEYSYLSNPNPFRSRDQAQAQAQPNFNKQRLWGILRWSSTVPVILAIFWYLDKLDNKNEIEKDGNGISMKEWRQEKLGPNEYKPPNAFGMHTFELAHYMFFLNLFYVFNISSSQPSKFWQVITFWFTIISFFGMLFSHVSSNLANYRALNAKAPFFYQISGTWSNHEGSFLMFCFLFHVGQFLVRLPFGKYY